MNARIAAREEQGIAIRGVSHRFGDRTVLRDISLDIREHRTAVIGGNGSGKSTFVRLLNGLVVPAEGTVVVDGLNTRTHGKQLRRRVGFVFQDPDAQIVFPTVAEDLGFGLKVRGDPPETIEARVRAALDQFGLSDHADHPAHLLSGGQKQLLALAGVMVTEPSYLVLDEPMTLLDLRNKHLIAETIMAVAQKVILATHELDLLDGFERVLVLDGGQIVADGAPHEAVAAYRRLMG